MLVYIFKFLRVDGSTSLNIIERTFLSPGPRVKYTSWLREIVKVSAFAGYLLRMGHEKRSLLPLHHKKYTRIRYIRIKIDGRRDEYVSYN